MQQNVNKWKDLELDEFFVFISITMLMTRNKKLDTKEYWSKDPLLNSPIFSKTISRDRYLQILRNLHFMNNEEFSSNDRLSKLGEVLRKIKDRFQSKFYPFQNLVIDESMILFKGWLRFKQYIKTKRHRLGIKLYVLCDCETGIFLDFIVYVGLQTHHQAEDVKRLGSSGSIVTILMDPYLNKVCILTITTVVRFYHNTFTKKNQYVWHCSRQ
ncbi:hypothetical protein NQ314_018341 [Rhamnusium bicolor]|uniref:PiggyBac transposable element-derived protein domain-containing protein n=1 Tax=Rhamnusium bicolor TaxID=1586634 RepID=A0AAV8WSN3_9CUCU|nr:hypothetical protein NQ314_018341 [Rhamnusium bicolor]